jgi:hypothetical protein
MEQIGSWLVNIPRSVLIAVLVPLITAALVLGAQRKVESKEGWTSVRPTAGLLLCGVLAGFLCLFFALWLVIGIVAAVQGGGAESLVVFGLIAPPLTAMFAYSAVYILFHRYRFNEDGVEHRAFGKSLLVGWTDIQMLKRHWFFGPTLRLKSGASLHVWEYYRGFPQLVATAEAKGVLIDLT